MRTPGRASTRFGAAVVWLVWSIAFAGAALYVVRYGSDVPHLDEWQMIGPGGAFCPASALWLMAPNNEHRIPLAKALYCGLMKVSGNDFRSGMFASVLILAAVSALLIAAAARARGRASLADAFFPLLLLHWGHAENFLHSFQITFTIPVALAAGLGAVMLGARTEQRTGLAAAMALCAIALPLCSLVGLAFAPAAVVWLLWSARDARREPGGSVRAAVLLGGAVVSTATSIFFLARLPHVPSLPPSPGARADLAVLGDLVVNGLGPAALSYRTIFLLLAIGLVVAAGSSSVRAISIRGSDLRRTIGLLLMLVATMVLLAGMAHARAGLSVSSGALSRYGLIASLLYLFAFLASFSARPLVARRLQLALLLAVALLAPANDLIGTSLGADLKSRLAPVMSDARAGATPEVLAERHRDQLLPWESTGRLAYLLSQLRAARVGPYRFLRATSSGDAGATPRAGDPGVPRSDHRLSAR